MGCRIARSLFSGCALFSRNERNEPACFEALKLGTPLAANTPLSCTGHPVDDQPTGCPVHDNGVFAASGVPSLSASKQAGSLRSFLENNAQPEKRLRAIRHPIGQSPARDASRAIGVQP